MSATGQSAVEAWEDGRRQTPGDGRAELWHFEASLAEGWTVAIGFCLVDLLPAERDEPERYRTVVNLMITTSDGQHREQAMTGTVRADAVSTQRCGLPFGPNTADGDLRSYDVHVETDDGTTVVDLRFDALTDPYWPRIAAPIQLDGDTARTFNVLIIARCAVTGTIHLDGVRHEVGGIGTHDHQWFDANPLTTWHHWIWGRLATEHHTAILFDLVTSAPTGLRRIPILGVFDTDGRLIFDNTHPVHLTSQMRVDAESGKELPLQATYRAHDADQTCTLDFHWQDDLLSKDLYESAGDSDELGSASREQYDQMNVQPSYTRSHATGTLTLTGPDRDFHETGEMFYELNYPGLADPSAFQATT